MYYVGGWSCGLLRHYEQTIQTYNYFIKLKDKIFHRQMRFSFSWLMGAVCASFGFVGYVGVSCAARITKKMQWWKGLIGWAIRHHTLRHCDDGRSISYVLICHPYVTRMSSVCHWYVLVRHPYVTRMSSVCHSHVLVCQPYVTRMHSYVNHTSLACTRMSSVCLVCTSMSSSIVLP